jgi:hypothetical protein
MPFKNTSDILRLRSADGGAKMPFKNTSDILRLRSADGGAKSSHGK